MTMLSNSILRRIRTSSLISTTVRSYNSRAHPPESIPVYAVGEALASVLEGVEERKVRRQQRWEKGAEKRKMKNIAVSLLCSLE